VPSDPSKDKPDRTTLDDLASAHVARLLAGPSQAEREAIDDWIDADPHHAVAFARMQAAWDSAERLRADPARINAFLRPPAGDIRWRRRALGALVAASLLCVCGLGIWLQLSETQTYRTRVGQQHTVHLADGSTVELNTATTVQVALRRDRRGVRILSGEAHFQVSHDPARPFLVDAGPARFRAVGTAFDVRIRSASVVDLTVTQGVVAVLSGKGADQRQPRIAAGRAAVIDGGAVAETVLGGETLRQRTAWEQGVIELNGQTLRQVVEEFNRYQAHPIVIGDARLESLRIGGRFQVNEADRFLAGLCAAFPINVLRTSDGGVLLVRRSKDSSDPG
jgi:transmembrane sensor